MSWLAIEWGIKQNAEVAENSVEMAVEPSVTPVLVPVRVEVRPRARALGVLTVALVATAIAAALAIGIWVVIDGYTGAGAEPGAFLVLLALVVVNEALSVNVFDDGTASPGEVPVLAAAVLCGPFAVPALEVTVTVAGAIARRQVNWWTFFNAGVFTLSGVAGAAVLAVAFSITSSPWLLLALGGVAGLLYFVVNGVLCALGAMVYWREPFRAFFARSVAWLAPYHVGYGVLSAALVLAHQAMGMIGLLVFAMPALAMLASMARARPRIVARCWRLMAASRPRFSASRCSSDEFATRSSLTICSVRRVYWRSETSIARVGMAKTSRPTMPMAWCASTSAAESTP